MYLCICSLASVRESNYVCTCEPVSAYVCVYVYVCSHIQSNEYANMHLHTYTHVRSSPQDEVARGTWAGGVCPLWVVALLEHQVLPSTPRRRRQGSGAKTRGAQQGYCCCEAHPPQKCGAFLRFPRLKRLISCLHARRRAMCACLHCQT